MMAIFLATDMMPTTLVEGKEFLSLMKAVDGRYQVPSRSKLLHHDLLQLQQKIQGKLQVMLSQAQWIALMFNMWTSNRHPLHP